MTKLYTLSKERGEERQIQNTGGAIKTPLLV
jgi:hypothetical protein